MTRTSFLMGLIGTGIGRSLSPELHEREADRHQVRCLYRLLDLGGAKRHTAENLHELLGAARSLGFAGLNVTHPVKQLVLPHLDRLAPTAARVGAVNTVVFADGAAVGHNTDGTGFAAALTRGLPDAPMRHVVQLGAGGAGSAVAHALLDLGAERVTVVDPAAGRARELAEALNTDAGSERARTCDAASLGTVLQEADGLVNASPVGTPALPRLPLDPAALHPGLWIVDINYRPLRTPLLEAGRALGCRTLHGGGMLVHQAAGTFRLVTGLEPRTAHMLADFADLTAGVREHS
ncbi:shikimate dehydrogenase [Streptomyces fructofermentans]|uniref:shikimate dehydrogenase n=1 Tax=Streptomyces fructofermentans TaxID=152141 RepID=UPI0033F22C44